MAQLPCFRSSQSLLPPSEPLIAPAPPFTTQPRQASAPAPNPNPGPSGPPGGPDIVAVGFQEVVPLSAGNALLGPGSEGADAWDYALASTLNGEEWCVVAFGVCVGGGVVGCVEGD